MGEAIFIVKSIVTALESHVHVRMFPHIFIVTILSEFLRLPGNQLEYFNNQL